MLGAIIGDIVGSRFEFNNHRSKDFELFTKDCFVTDDSIMTIAVAKAVMEAEKNYKASLPTPGDYDANAKYHKRLARLTVNNMRGIGRKYPNCGYGGRFRDWMFSDDPKPYGSYGNGSAMRVSPAGIAAYTESDAISISKTVTAVTHDHEEGIKGAEAVAVAIFMARNGFTKSEIREKIDGHYYRLNFEIGEIRETYEFNETCQDTVPQAIEAFLESVSFEDAIRTAVSVGGDTDTLAAITGSIAEAYYGVPHDIKEKALAYLDKRLRDVYDEWTDFAGDSAEEYKVLTKYIGKLSPASTGGEHWQFPQRLEGYGYELLRDLDYFIESHPEYDLKNYNEILEKKGLGKSEDTLRSCDVSTLDARCVLAMFTAVYRASRFCDGMWESFVRDGYAARWLKRLKDIDAHELYAKPTVITLEENWHKACDTYNMTLTKDEARLFWYEGHGFSAERFPLSYPRYPRRPVPRKVFFQQDTERLIATLKNIHAEYWRYEYLMEEYGEEHTEEPYWRIFIREEGSRGIFYTGYGIYPETWAAFRELFNFDIKNSLHVAEHIDDVLDCVSSPSDIIALDEEDVLNLIGTSATIIFITESAQNISDIKIAVSNALAILCHVAESERLTKLIFRVVSGENLSMSVLKDIAQFIVTQCGEGADILWCYECSPGLGETINITLLTPVIKKGEECIHITRKMIEAQWAKERIEGLPEGKTVKWIED